MFISQKTGFAFCSDVLKALLIFTKLFRLGGSVGTVGQEVVELICQKERKTQQNAKISLWSLFSTEMDLIQL